MAGQTQWNTKVVMAWHGIVENVAWHIWMDMDDKKTWMTVLKTSKIVSTVWCKKWLMKQITKVSGSRDAV